VSSQLTDAKARLKLLRDFPWVGASPEAKASVFQDLFEALSSIQQRTESSQSALDRHICLC
jgi:hypothetical protein